MVFSVTDTSAPFLVHGFLWSEYGDEEATKKELLACAEKGKLPPFEKLYGAYSVVLPYPDGKVLFFTDHSNMHTLYHSKDAISTSFIELIRYEAAKGVKLNLDRDYVAQYMIFGKTFPSKTAVEGITQSDCNTYYIAQNGKITVKDKGIGDMRGVTSLKDFKEFFDKLARVVGDRPLLIAQTGGYDSRTVSAMLKDIPNVRLFIQGNNPDALDVTVGRKVAEAEGRPYDFIRGKQRPLTEEMLRRVFVDRDGNTFGISASLVETYDYQDAYKAQGYHLQFTGDGGAMHKDEKWLPDIPFYRKKKYSLPRFFEQRVNRLHNEKALTQDMLQRYPNIREEALRRMQELTKGLLNTEAYDVLYYYYINNSMPRYTLSSTDFVKYAPLFEMQLTRFSFHQPRRFRYFYNLYRHYVTLANPAVARIPTNYGTTCSSELRCILRDIPVQYGEYFRRFKRMIDLRLYHHAKSTNNIWEETLSKDEVLGLEIIQKAIRFAKEQNIILADVDPKDLEMKRISQVLYFYMISELFAA